MAIYSPTEIREILSKLSEKPISEPKFFKFERLGVLISSESEDEATEDSKISGSESQHYVCSVCRKWLASYHLLDLHVIETHDSFFQLQKEKKPMYSCYLEECKHKSSTPEERKDHCITSHKFPHNFRFEECASSTKKKSPVNPRKQSVDGQQMDTTEEPATSTDITEATKPPKFRNFHFGHKSQKAFKSQPKKSNPLETMNVDMTESLPQL